MKVCGKLLAVLVIAGCAGLTAGCAVNRATGQVTPGVDMSQVNSYYVVKADTDKHDLNEIIVRQLTDRGFSASTGSGTAMPESAGTKVTYIDRWMWDITMYLLELTISISDAQTDYTLASGNSYHTSLTRKSAEEMVEEVLGNIFGEAEE